MLRKLVKYEWKATSRVLLPLYGAVLLIALVNRLLMIPSGGGFMHSGADWAQTIALMLYFGLMVAVFVVTIVILIQRFYKSLLGDEGYLMFTLPVTPAQNIWAKTIVATIMTVLSGIVAMLSVFVLASSVDMWRILAEGFGEVFRWMFSNVNYPLFALEFILLMIVGTVGGTLTLYLCMALGHLAKRHRVAASVGAYFGLGAVGQTVTTLLFNIADWTNLDKLLSGLSNNAALHVMMLFLILYCLADAVISFIIINYILKRHLNLE